MTAQAATETLLRVWDGKKRVVVKECSSLGGTLAVRKLDAQEAVEHAVSLASSGRDVLMQPDLAEYFALGETKVCLQLSQFLGDDVSYATHVTSRVLGGRHAPPGGEFGRFFLPEDMPVALCRLAMGAAEVLRTHALALGVGVPPILRVDCIELPNENGERVWCVNEYELADFASWMWGWACTNEETSLDEAVCNAHAKFIAQALAA